jgi:hypothetical protein
LNGTALSADVVSPYDVDIEYKVVPFTRDRAGPALELHPLVTASEVGERDSRIIEVLWRKKPDGGLEPPECL